MLTPYLVFFWVSNSSHGHEIDKKDFVERLAYFVSWRFSAEHFNYDFGPTYAKSVKPMCDVTFRYADKVNKFDPMFSEVSIVDGIAKALPDSRGSSVMTMSNFFGAAPSVHVKKKKIPDKKNDEKEVITPKTNVTISLDKKEKEKKNVADVQATYDNILNEDLKEPVASSSSSRDEEPASLRVEGGDNDDGRSNSNDDVELSNEYFDVEAANALLAQLTINKT